MLLKLAVSFVCGVTYLYLMFCLLLNAPILGGGDIKAIADDIKHRWFWVMSIYIGKAIMLSIALAFIVGIPYILIYF